MNYRLIDLFSGCGGISEGFRQTGKICVVGAIDSDDKACETFAKNFPDANVINGDITEIDVEKTGFSDIDIIVGGPPCQGFSGLNRWDKNAQDDPRNKLFFEFIRFVDYIKPKALLIENVRQILTAKNGFAKNKITELLTESGYNVCHAVLDASDFGVPQNRKRAFFVGIRKDIGEFNFDSIYNYKKEKVTVWDALSDISEIEEIATEDNSGYNYTLGKPKSKYQEQMRSGNILNSHFIYYPVESVLKKIRHVPEGGNWKCVPEELFKSKRNNRHSNYLKRLDSKSQSVTIDTGHNVYFHPKFDRVPTVRECARIQSFSDDFEFIGGKMQQFRQVGNAVPPLLANALAKAILEVLDNESI
ncbi:DNA cytosine methyltransferase [Clostridium sp. KNHs214]|uniref:DNA cytosine methyltransferase n=1 Tax=Clostridium sp. KNHs214 TaxID=1540257 RepID=UPI00054D22A6|nr:DNA cytosine methyltransferase [Clostridium sp. KNHs214]